MNTLTGDPLMQIFGGGLAVSVGLLFFLLRKYRGRGAGTHSDAAAVLLPDEAELPEPVKVVSAPKSSDGPLLKEAGAKPARVSAVKAEPAGAASPAVVYLQNLKVQMELFEKEIHTLRGQVSSFAQKHDQQFDALLARMSQLQEELHAGKREPTAPAAAPVLAPAPSPKKRAAAEPASAAPEPAPAPAKAAEATQPTEIFSPEEAKNLKLDPPPSAKAPAAAAGAPAFGEPEDILKPKGKGPVWPV